MLKQVQASSPENVLLVESGAVYHHPGGGEDEDKENQPNTGSQSKAFEVLVIRNKSVKVPFLTPGMIESTKSIYKQLYSCADGCRLPSVHFLIGDGEVVNCHQAVVHMFCPHMFHVAIENGRNLIKLDESACTRPTVKAIIDYLYHDRLLISRQNWNEMMSFAKFLQLEELVYGIRGAKKKFGW